MHENQLSRYGAISRLNPAIPTGKTFFVIGASDANLPSFQSEYPSDKDGVDRVYTTIAAAIAACVSGRGDVVYIAPGTYTITAALVPVANTSFIAMRQSNPRVPTVTITGNIADLIQIDVNDTYWEGIEFKASGNTADNLVDIADGAAVTGCTFIRCVFNGVDKTTVIGLNLNDATFAVVGLVVKECLFRDLTGTCINVGVLGFAYSHIRDNQFAIDVNSGVGIALADTTSFAIGKGYVIEHNVFTGFDATADEVGITIAGTEDTTGAGIIRNNYFAYMAAAAVTIDKLSKSEVNNYYGDAATGGTLVDPGT